MKTNLKLFLIISLIVSIFSCQQEDANVSLDSGVDIQLKSMQATSIPSITSQLVRYKIPFYLQTATGDYMALDSEYPRTKALGTSDDFMWELQTPFLGLPGYFLKNTKGYNNNFFLGFTFPEGDNSKTPKMILNPSVSWNSWYIDKVKNTDLYYTVKNIREGPGTDRVNVYLTSFSNQNCVLREQSNVYDQEWMITPTGEYVVNSVEYTLSTEDITTMTPAYVMNLPLDNDSPTEINRNIKLTGSYTEESGFSDVHGVSVSIKNSSSSSFEVPTILGGTTNTETTTTETWSYTNNEKRVRNIAVENSLTFTQPPFTSYSVKIVGSEYKMNATYLMYLTQSPKGFPLTASGKWKGIQVYDIRVIVKDETNNIIVTDVPIEEIM